jgi:hypothetical protein
MLFALLSCDNEIVNPAENTQAELQTETSSNRNLKNSLSASISVWDPEVYFEVSGADGASINVNWGDGTSETVTLATENVITFHTYPSAGWYSVSITGDLDQITTFDPFLTAEIKSLNLSRLKNLREIDMTYLTVDVLDLSRNMKLEAIVGMYSNATGNIILPKHHNIRLIEFAGDGFSTAEVDAIIESVYNNAVKKGILNGEIALSSPEVEFPEFAGPPSPASMEMLIKLRDEYGWMVFPNP